MRVTGFSRPDRPSAQPRMSREGRGSQFDRGLANRLESARPAPCGPSRRRSSSETDSGAAPRTQEAGRSARWATHDSDTGTCFRILTSNCLFPNTGARASRRRP
jgi:hypothetical protein